MENITDMNEPQIHKKGISEIISYVILIIIAIGLGVLVYNFLILYVSESKIPECESDVSVIIQNYSCKILDGQQRFLRVDVFNKGYFKVDAIFIRLGSESRKIRPQVNVDSEVLPNPLNPGENISLLSTFGSGIVPSQGNYIIEIEPAVKTPKGYSLCSKAIITESIVCS